MRWIWAPLFFAAALHGAEEPGITRSQAEAILNELKQIRQLLEQQRRAAAPAPQEQLAPAKLKLEGGQALGAKDAPITMVEFTDYQCPFCRRFHTTTFTELRKKYIDTGKVRFFSRDFPLDMHRDAMRAAEAGHCAADQGKFWPMRELLSENPGKLSEPDVLGYAAKVGLDVKAFGACLTSGKHREAVRSQIAEAGALGIQGTPSFIVGKTTPEGVEGVIVVGALPLENFEAVFGKF